MSVLATEVRPYAGVPTIFVNGTPVSGLMHWNRNMEAGDVRAFAEAGITVFSFLGNIDLGDGSTVQDGCQPCHTMTPQYIESMMRRILEGNPKALVIPRFRMQASDAWKERHPDQLMRYFNLQTNRFDEADTKTMVTLGSQEWIDDSLAALERAIEHCENTWGDSILGYHSGHGHCAEHVYLWGSKIADYHPSMLERFRQWVREHYGTVDALRTAWREATLEFERVEFPRPDRFTDFTPTAMNLLDPARDQAMIGMLRFHSEYMASLVVRQATCAKAALARLGSTKIFGAFYGYANLPANLATHYSEGQDAHDMVLACEALDFLSAPVGYSARQPGGVSTAQTLPGSAILAGKLYYAEDDTGTHLTKMNHNTAAATLEQSVQMLTRGFLDVWRTGGTQWFMDLFGEGDYRDPELTAALGPLASFAARHLDDRQSTAEVAVFVSDRSLSYSKTFNFLTGSLIEHQFNELASLGASYDLFRIEDLPRLVGANRVNQYKLAVMLNAHVLSDELRELVNRHLQCDNRTLLWFHAPGIIGEGGFDVERSNELTGIHTVLQTRGRASLITEVLIGGERFSYGMQQSVYPRLLAADPEAETLGYLVEGTGIPFRQNSDGGTLVRKRFADHCSLWSASPNMPSGLLSRFAADAGVHIYCTCGSQVFHTRNWLGIHAKWDGQLKLSLPGRMTLFDAFTGECVVDHADTYCRTVRRGDNILLERRES